MPYAIFADGKQSLLSSEKQVATGTDDKYVAVAQNGLAKLTPKLTPMAFPECKQLSANDTDKRNVPKIAKTYNDLNGRNLGVKNDNLSPTDTDNGEGGIRTRGRDEPYTAFPRLLDKPLRHLSGLVLSF